MANRRLNNLCAAGCRLLLAVLVCATIAASGVAFADHRHDHEKAFKAYEAGDYVEAARLFLHLAERGSVNAQYNLGLMYAAGKGVPQDYYEAFNWYLLAAEQGDINAQLRVGVMYGYGMGVEHDHFESYKWILVSGANEAKQEETVKQVIGDLMIIIGHMHHVLRPDEKRRAEEWARGFRPRSRTGK